MTERTIASAIRDGLLKQISPQEVLGLTIYGEARGEPIEGQIAVGCIIRNRMNTGKYTTYKEVCLEEKQFSCWNENDPNYPMLIDIMNKLAREETVTDLHLKQCLYIAAGIKSHILSDNTNNAHHYMTKKLLYSNDKPDWALKTRDEKAIGNHVFFNV